MVGKIALKSLNVKYIRSNKMRVLVILIYLCQLAYGSTSLNADKRRASYFQYAIALYEKNNHRLPHSWGDLRASKESSDYVVIIEKMEIKGFTNDFVKTFRFIPPEVEIRIKDASELVVAMAIRRMISDENHVQPNGYRLLIVQTIDKGIILRQLPEDAVDFLFAKAGFKISDYTGVGGKWAVENEIEIFNPNPILDINRRNENEAQLIDGSNSEVQQPDAKPSKAIWFFCCLVGCLGALFVWFKFIHKKSSSFTK
jgi:hypothetical protein